MKTGNKGPSIFSAFPKFKVNLRTVLLYEFLYEILNFSSHTE